MMLRTLRRDRRGIAAIEFSILAPVMLLMICSALELGHMIFARMILDGAVVDAARIATSTLETEEGERTTVMRNGITKAMQEFPTAKGRQLTIQTTVYRDFSSAYPEAYNDSNKNGQYNLGESYTDRNANGKWDNATPIGGTLGGPGDVVAYTAIFPKRILFGHLSAILGLGTELTIKSSTVVRNESVVRRTN